MLSGFELYPRLGAPGYATWPTGHRCMTDRMWLHRIVSVLSVTCYSAANQSARNIFA